MRFRDFRRIDRRLGEATDVPRRIHIRVVGVPTGHAAELCLRWAVACIGVSTDCAHLAGVGRVDANDIDACLYGLVFDKCAQLAKCPATHPRSLCPAKPCPVADALEVFQGNAACGVFGLGNERFRNTVVFVGAKSPLFPRKCFEFPADALGARPATLSGGSSLLQAGAQRVLLAPDGFDRITAVVLSVTVGGDVGHPKINANKVCRWRLDAVRHIDGHEQKPLAILAPDEIALPLGVGKALLLIFAHDHGHDDAPGKGQQRHAVNPLEAHQALIVGDGGERPEARAFRFVPLVGFARLSDTAYRHLRRQPEARSQLGVVEPLQQELVGGLSGKRLSCQPVGSGVERAHGRFKRQGLLWRGEELRLQRQLHALNYSRLLSMHQDRRRRFLPRLKSGASALRIL